MAVVSLYGKVDSTSVIFRLNDKGLWETTVPFNQDGMYIVDLIAVDEAGNESYYATVLFTVNTSNINCKVQIKILKFYNKTNLFKLDGNQNEFYKIKTSELNVFNLKNTTSNYNLCVRGCACVL